MAGFKKILLEGDVHGPAQHTEGNAWKILYLDTNGNETELSLVAGPSQTVGFQYLRSTSATGAPEFKERMEAITITVEDPTASENIGVFFFGQAVTIREIEATIKGSTSVTIDPYHHADRSGSGGATDILSAPLAISSTTSINIPAEAGTLNSVAISADSWLILETTALSGTPDELSLTFRYTFD